MPHRRTKELQLWCITYPPGSCAIKVTIGLKENARWNKKGQIRICYVLFFFCKKQNSSRNAAFPIPPTKWSNTTQSQRNVAPGVAGLLTAYALYFTLVSGVLLYFKQQFRWNTKKVSPFKLLWWCLHSSAR